MHVGSVCPARKTAFYFASKDTYLYALDAQTGELKWKNNLAGSSWVTSSPAVSGEMVYAGTSDGRALYAVRADTGEIIWQFLAKGYVWGSPSLAGDVVYVGSGSKSFYAINALTGQELWHFETGGPVYSTRGSRRCGVFRSSDRFVYALLRRTKHSLALTFRFMVL
jgi:outer membrane protein assembly factor BamB